MFNNFPFFRSASFEEAKAIHDEWDLDLELRGKLGGREPMATVANVYESPVIGLYGYRYEKSVTLNARSSNPHFWISVAGGTGAQGICRPASPGDDDPMHLEGGQEMLGIRFDGKDAMSFIEAYLGEDLQRPIRFMPEKGYSGPADALIKHRLSQLSHGQQEDVVFATSPKQAAQMLEQCFEALLLFRKHSHQAFVRKAARAPAPRDVRRAIDYIHAFAGDQPSLAHLAEVSGVPGRTLSLHFGQFVGASPIAYLNRVRLQNARIALRSGDVGTVAEAALAQGFAHLGRFSKVYRDAFGELPRETLFRTR